MFRCDCGSEARVRNTVSGEVLYRFRKCLGCGEVIKTMEVRVPEKPAPVVLTIDQLSKLGPLEG